MLFPLQPEEGAVHICDNNVSGLRLVQSHEEEVSTGNTRLTFEPPLNWQHSLLETPDSPLTSDPITDPTEQIAPLTQNMHQVTFNLSTVQTAPLT